MAVSLAKLPHPWIMVHQDSEPAISLQPLGKFTIRIAPRDVVSLPEHLLCARKHAFRARQCSHSFAQTYSHQQSRCGSPAASHKTSPHAEPSQLPFRRVRKATDLAARKRQQVPSTALHLRLSHIKKRVLCIAWLRPQSVPWFMLRQPACAPQARGVSTWYSSLSSTPFVGIISRQPRAWSCQKALARMHCNMLLIPASISVWLGFDARFCTPSQNRLHLPFATGFQHPTPR